MCRQGKQQRGGRGAVGLHAAAAELYALPALFAAAKRDAPSGRVAASMERLLVLLLLSEEEIAAATPQLRSKHKKKTNSLSSQQTPQKAD